MSSRPRLLTEKEQAVLGVLLRDNSEAAHLLSLLPFQLVTEMADGGMGSLQFYRPEKVASRRYGDDIAQIELQDEDGIPVMVSLIVDQDNQLYELEMWKVDFSPTTNLMLPSD